MVDVTFNLANFEYYLLILVRMVSFIYLAPVIGSRGVPNRVKIGVGALISLMIFQVVDRPTLEYTSVIGYAIYVLREGITGLLIGFAANICSSVLLFAGNIIDMDIGFSMATEFNPEMGTESTITGNFYYYLVMLILVASDMHVFVLRAMCDSFSVVPVGGAVFAWDHLLLAMVKYITDLFIIAFRIFLPVFATIMILNVILGIMAKVAPQMNMFAVGMQLKVLTGLLVLFLTAFMVPNIANFLFQEIKEMVVLILEGMY